MSKAAAGAWRSKSSLPGEHGQLCCSHMSRRACEVDKMHEPRRACAADFSHSPRLIKHLHARHRVWLNFDTVNIIQLFAILTCQLLFQKGLRYVLMCAMSMKPCQVSCFLGEFLIYWDLKTEILNVSGRR